MTVTFRPWHLGVLSAIAVAVVGGVLVASGGGDGGEAEDTLLATASPAASETPRPTATLRAGVTLLTTSTPGPSATAQVTQAPSVTSVPPTATPVPSPTATFTPSPTATPAGVQDAANRLFVDPVRGSDNNNGKRATPFLTLQRALQAAESLNEPVIYVAGGNLGGLIYIASAVRLFGGYDPAVWLPADNQVSTLSAVDGPALVIEAGGVTVDGFVIEAAGTSNFHAAVHVIDAADVVLSNNAITAPDGMAGEPGIHGLPGEEGKAGAKGDDYSPCPPDNVGGAGGSGFVANGGQGGAGGLFGGFDGSGGGSVDSQVLGGAGGQGIGWGAQVIGPVNRGGQGYHGLSQKTPGVGGGPLGRVEDGEYYEADGEAGVSIRTHGAGGGGGGGGYGVGFAPLCGAAGGGGGGGGERARTDGLGGSGGGPSIAIIVDNSSVTLSGNLIQTGRGGEGGPGGNGARGGLGGAAGPPGILDTSDGGPAAGAGGAGGWGGDSAPGGGGGGGPSIGVLADAASTVTMSGNTLQLGSGGSGGPGGAPPQEGGGAGGHGEDGLVAEFYQSPAP